MGLQRPQNAYPLSSLQELKIPRFRHKLVLDAMDPSEGSSGPLNSSFYVLNLESNTTGLRNSSAFSEVAQDISPPTPVEETPNLKATSSLDIVSSSSEEDAEQSDPDWVPEIMMDSSSSGSLVVRRNGDDLLDISSSPLSNSSPNPRIKSSEAPPDYLVRLLSYSGWKVEFRGNPGSHVYVSPSGQEYWSLEKVYEAFLRSASKYNSGYKYGFSSRGTVPQSGVVAEDFGKKGGDAMMGRSPAAETVKKIRLSKEPILEVMNTSQQGNCLEDNFNQMSLIGSSSKENEHDAIRSATLSFMEDENKPMTTSPPIVNVNSIADKHSKKDSENSSCANADVIDLKWTETRRRSCRKHRPVHGVMDMTESGSSPGAGTGKEKLLTAVSVLGEERPPSLNSRCLNGEVTGMGSSSMHHSGDIVGARRSDRLKGKYIPLIEESDTELEDYFDYEPIDNNHKGYDFQGLGMKNQHGDRDSHRNVKPCTGNSSNSKVDMMIEAPVSKISSVPSTENTSSTKRIISTGKQSETMNRECLEKEFNFMPPIGNSIQDKCQGYHHFAFQDVPFSIMKDRNEQMTTSSSDLNLLQDGYSKNDSPSSSHANVAVLGSDWDGNLQRSNTKQLPVHGVVMDSSKPGLSQATGRDKEKALALMCPLNERTLPSLEVTCLSDQGARFASDSVALPSQLNASPVQCQDDIIGACHSDHTKGTDISIDDGSAAKLQADDDNSYSTWLQTASQLHSDGHTMLTKNCPSSVIDMSTITPVSEKYSLSSAPKETSTPTKICMLSWLIGSGALIEKEYVYCLPKIGSNKLYSGLVTREGILCECCKEVLSLLKFQAHAGCNPNYPWYSIYLQSGKPLIACISEAWEKVKVEKKIGFQMISDGPDSSDDICGVCEYGGNLVSCDSCPSSFHQDCLKLKSGPEGRLYCPYCICKFCTGADRRSGRVRETSSLLKCKLCGCKYHYVCSVGKPSYSFCGRSCKEIADLLSSILGISHPIEGGFSWTLLKRVEEDEGSSSVERFSSIMEWNAKLSMAFSIMNECFTPIEDERTGLDKICQAIYNCGSNFNRLNYEGFYTLILEKNEEIISAATLRFHGRKLAELPFIGTRIVFRRQGMCRLLLKVVEEMLASLFVEKLVIPVEPQLVKTWTSSFSFKPLEPSHIEEIKNLSMLIFPSTPLLQKPIYSNVTTGQKDNMPSSSTSSIYLPVGDTLSEISLDCWRVAGGQ